MESTRPAPENTDDDRPNLHTDRRAPAARRRGGQLVSTATLEALWTPQPDAHSSDYGHGFGVEHGPCGRVIGHGGGFPGLNGKLDMYVDAGWTVAVLCNYDRGAGRVADRARALLERVEWAGPPVLRAIVAEKPPPWIRFLRSYGHARRVVPPQVVSGDHPP